MLSENKYNLSITINAYAVWQYLIVNGKDL